MSVSDLSVPAEGRNLTGLFKPVHILKKSCNWLTVLYVTILFVKDCALNEQIRLMKVDKSREVRKFKLSKTY